MKIFTIGFTKTSAENFFARLKKARVRRIIDVRVHNNSQLAGFAKQDDLAYFAKTICGAAYEHRLELAPTEEMMTAYRKEGGDWDDYARKFRALIAKRRIEKMDREAFDGACLLCSEDKPHRCHRSVIAQYLKEKWKGVEVVHL